MELPKYFLYKIGTLLSLLIFSASFMVTNNVMSVIKAGPSMSILFANEYALTLVSLLGSAIRFSLNCIDAISPETPLEQRSTIIFYLDFFVDLFKLIIYTGFFGVVMSFYGLPIHIIRDLYVTAISFSKRVKDMINYHRIMSNLQTRYPDATPEELEACSDPTCIICREEMVSSVKRLPCGHFFHFKCLKSWLERQQVCPTCRKSVLEVVKPPAPVLYPADHRREWNDSDSQTSFNTGNSFGSQSSFNTRDSQSSLNTQTRNDTQGSLNRSNSVASTTRLLLSPLRRSHSTSSVFPLQPDFLMNEDEKEILISEGEKLKIVAELERIGRRSRSPLSQSPASNFCVAVSNESPLSPLSHVKSRIEYVQELMTEHENILIKLRQIETEIVREKSFSRSTNFNLDDDEKNL